MKKTTLLLALILVLTFNLQSANSQNTKPIKFQGFEVNLPNNIKSFDWDNVHQRASDDGMYLLVQFDKIPNQQVQNNFKSMGIELRNYISNNSYFLYFPNRVSTSFLENSGVISMISVPNEFKVSSDIRNNVIGAWAVSGNNIHTNISFHKGISKSKVIGELSTIAGTSIIEQYDTGNVVMVSIPVDKVNEVANLPSIKWMELIPQPGEKEDDNGKSLHRSSNLDTQTLSGRNYTGEGIGVMVRDDGIVGPHIDFQGRIDNSLASGSGPTHGDGVAGIMAGAGNLNPANRGMAAGANIFVVNYAPSHLDNATTSLIDNGNVQITNSSYGDGCNGGYTTTTNTVDTQSNNRLELLHVFSAGNSGTSNCGYGAGAGWGNITGGHKQGKNVIATANVFANGSMPDHSSNGPAYDGRIKPDITAHGQGQISTDENNGYLTFGGTSGAAPGIAGISAQLYQLYKDQNGGILPEAALIKAALLNTANDYGNVGPDFRFGWGMVNGLRAAMLLEDNRYLADEITQGANNNHTINVPANTTQVRFMVYWNDPAAVAGSSTALVNDLDLKVTAPGSTEHLPWILNPAPDATTLDLPATNGIDRLNNMEQVLINNPAAGDYTINVDGFNIPIGPQKYHIVYEIITEELVLTYPNGGEKLVAGAQVPIHWDATNTTDGFDLEYSTDNGASWTNITSVANTATNFFWNVPAEVSGEALIRITSGAYTDTSDNTFSMAGTISGLNIAQVCPTELRVVWDAFSDATSYDIYLLGEKNMEKVGTSNSNSFNIPIMNPAGSFWVAVSAKGGATNWETRRSIAVNRTTTGLFNCALNNDLAVESLNTDLNAINVICTGSNQETISMSIQNFGAVSESNFTVSYQLDTNTIVNETFTGTIAPGSIEEYTFTTPLVISQEGSHTLKVWVDLTDDEFGDNDQIEGGFYTQINPTVINDLEDFETAGFIPGGWSVENSDGLTTWDEVTVNGAASQPTNVARMNNFDYATNGQEDVLVTEVYDLSSGTNVVLSFDLAKAQRSEIASDALRVEISTDCGATSTVIYEKSGLDLSTVPGYIPSLNWTPSFSGQWRNEVIDLAAYQGQNVQIRFVNVNNSGNNTYIDNVNIDGVLSTNTDEFDSNFTLFPNPTENRFTIRSKRVDIDKLMIYDLLGKKIKTVKINENEQIINVDVENLPAGIYMVRLESDLGVFYKKIIKS